MLRASEVKSKGTKGTYVSAEGGIGLGYQMNGKIYRSVGNGYYEEINVQKFYADGGERYNKVVRGIMPMWEIQ